MNFINAVWRPNIAIAEAKKKKSMKDSLIVLALACVILGLAFAGIIFSIANVFGPSGDGLTGALITGIVVIVLVFLCMLVKGFFLQKLMEALGAKSDYFAGVSTFAYMLLPLSVGVLLASILISFVPYIGLLLALIVATPFMLMGIATLYNGVRVFFSTDMVTALVAIGAYTLGMFIIFYLIIIMVMIPGVIKTAGALGTMGMMD